MEEDKPMMHNYLAKLTINIDNATLEDGKEFNQDLILNSSKIFPIMIHIIFPHFLH